MLSLNLIKVSVVRLTNVLTTTIAYTYSDTSFSSMYKMEVSLW